MGLHQLLIHTVPRRQRRRKQGIYLGHIASAFQGFQHLLRLLPLRRADSASERGAGPEHARTRPHRRACKPSKIHDALAAVLANCCHACSQLLSHMHVRAHARAHVLRGKEHRRQVERGPAQPVTGFFGVSCHALASPVARR